MSKEQSNSHGHIAAVRHSDSTESFIKNIIQYYVQELPEVDFIAISAKKERPFYEVLTGNGDKNKMFKTFTRVSETINPDKELSNMPVYFLTEDDKRTHLFFFGLDDYNKQAALTKEFNDFNVIYQIINFTDIQSQNRSSEQYATMISHITHDISSLLSHMEQPAKSEYLQNKMDYFEQVIPNLLLFSREIELVPTSVNLDDLLKGVVDNFEHTNLLNLKSFEGDYSIYCDVELFNQMMGSILDNALFGQNNMNRKIDISIEIVQGLKLLYPRVILLIIIDDSGPGIIDEYMPLVFNPFFTTRKSREHSGFGLAIAQKIAQAHHGHISIENRQSAGCRVTVCLPLSVDRYEAK